MRPEIKPLVKLIDDTTREGAAELLAHQLRAGVPYRQLLAAAFLVAIRRGGHHSVYLVHAAHQMSLDAPPTERLFPLFWAVDVNREHMNRAGYKPVPPLRGKLPAPEKAQKQFHEGMEKGDGERAELALMTLARNQGGRATMEQFLPYAARDWSFVGHLAISVVNCRRTLQTIGWQHAEPVLSFVVRDLHRWPDRKNKIEDQSYYPNRDRVKEGLKKLPGGWMRSSSDPERTLELLGVIRQGDWKSSCEWVYRRLIEGKVSAGTVWDAVHLAAAEFMIRFKLGGRRITHRALHSNTSANALHYVFRTCADKGTRLLILSQAVGWVTAFIANEDSRGMLRDRPITEMPSVQLPDSPHEAVEAIFSLLPPRKFGQEISDRSGQDKASRMTFALVQKLPSSRLLLETARGLLCRKATHNAHDYKFPIALFEDLNWIGSRWRPHLLAASVHYLASSRQPDSAAIERARQSLKNV